MTLAVDILANAIRSNPRDIAAGTLAERYLRALHAADYIVKNRDEVAATERERCAKIAETVGADGTEDGEYFIARLIADKIRGKR